MEPDKIMEGISAELLVTLQKMAKAKSVEQKLQYSQVVKNLCESLGVFIDLASGMMPLFEEEAEEDGMMPF
jgi:hypothetical protein